MLKIYNYKGFNKEYKTKKTEVRKSNFGFFVF